MIHFTYLYNEIIKENLYDIQYFDFDIVIDIGANIGMFSTFIRSHNKDCKIICYEPQVDLYNYLTLIFKHDLNTQIFNAPVWDGSEISFKKENNKSLVSFYKSKENKIQSISFDDVIGDIDITKKILLKIDGEGCEKNIFTLKMIEFIKLTKQTCIEFHYSRFQMNDLTKEQYKELLYKYFCEKELIIKNECSTTFIAIIKEKLR